MNVKIMKPLIYNRLQKYRSLVQVNTMRKREKLLVNIKHKTYQ